MSVVSPEQLDHPTFAIFFLTSAENNAESSKFTLIRMVCLLLSIEPVFVISKTEVSYGQLEGRLLTPYPVAMHLIKGDHLGVFDNDIFLVAFVIVCLAIS